MGTSESEYMLWQDFIAESMGIFDMPLGTSSTRKTGIQKEFKATYKPKEKYEHPFLKPNNQD